MTKMKQKMNITKQIRSMYALTTVGYFRIAGASWVALLALRGFSILEIGMLESIFHIVSFIFEIPSGVVADVFGRKKTVVLSQVFSIISCLFMMISSDFATVAVAIGLCALSYNLASGTREALAYDSLKQVGEEERYNSYASTEMMLYRITNSTATLLAGVALIIGYKKAYLVDVVFNVVALFIALSLVEAEYKVEKKDSILAQIQNVITESVTFLKNNKRARNIIVVNAIIGAISTLVLFFLQAKLPQAGLSDLLLGPALFVMGMGAALGSKMVTFFPKSKYKTLLIMSTIGVFIALGSCFTQMPILMIIGGFLGAFADDFLEVRTDVILNEIIPSEQRATLVSTSSFVFSVVMIVLSTLLGYAMN